MKPRPSFLRGAFFCFFLVCADQALDYVRPAYYGPFIIGSGIVDDCQQKINLVYNIYICIFVS